MMAPGIPNDSELVLKEKTVLFQSIHTELDGFYFHMGKTWHHTLIILNY